MEEIVVTLEDGTDKMMFIERSCNNKRDGNLFQPRNSRAKSRIDVSYLRSKNIDRYKDRIERSLYLYT